MGSTYLSLHYHIVFATKHREPTIQADWISQLHEYLGGTVRGLDGIPEAIGGVADHVHLLVGLRATHTLADFVRELKKAGTLWIRQERLDLRFAWQEGYAAFTVSPPARAGVKRYINAQPERHRHQSSADELKWLLQTALLDFDPRFFE